MPSDTAHPNKLQYQVFHGPNLLTEFPMVLAHFSFADAGIDIRRPIEDDEIERLRPMLPPALHRVLQPAAFRKSLPVFIAHLANALQQLRTGLAIRSVSGVKSAQAGHAGVGYVTPAGAVNALEYAVAAGALIKGLIPADELKARTATTLRQQRILQPGPRRGAIFNAAIKLGIPFHSLDDRAGMTVLGQGCHSLLVDADADTGGTGSYPESEHRRSDHEVVKLMGYPATARYQVATLEAAMAAVEKLGFPVVIKSTDSAQDETANAPLHTAADLEEAYRGKSGTAVLLERPASGTRYRIIVSNGQVIAAIGNIPAHVTGDGTSTVAELIARENAARPEEPKERGLLTDIPVNDALRHALASRSLSLASVPSPGEQVFLHRAPAMATGGTIVDVIDELHPDTRAMCIDIARNLRACALGIDFVTTDIARSWRAGGAVVATHRSAALFDGPTLPLLHHCFAGRGADQGRIPVTLVISDNEEKYQPFAELARESEGIGYADGERLILNGAERQPPGDQPNLYCGSLLLDPECLELVARVPLRWIAAHGLPLDQFHTCLVDGEISALPENSALLERLMPLLRSRSNRLELV